MTNTIDVTEALRQKAKQEALMAWRGVEFAASVFGTRRADYCLSWLLSVYGDTFGLETEL